MNSENKARIQRAMKTRLREYQNGSVAITVANQHHEYVLSSALENIHRLEEAAADIEPDVIDNVSTMEWAFRLSSFQPEPLESAWID